MRTALHDSYRRCRAITRAHGTTYFWATGLLPKASRRHVWALYAFARHADDIVDEVSDDITVSARSEAIDAFGDCFFADLAAGRSDDPLLAAVVATAIEMRIEPDCFHRFMRSMKMDLTITGYDTWEELLDYMDGSAAVIGEMMLPVLAPTSPRALGPARQLGLAFQLTNFLRDVGEDLDRQRVYIPRHDLERFGADPWSRHVDDAWRDLMEFEILRCRRLYRDADAGLAMLPGASGRCVRTARILYSQILERIEQADYDVFSGRRRVPTWRKLATAGGQLARR